MSFDVPAGRVSVGGIDLSAAVRSVTVTLDEAAAGVLRINSLGGVISVSSPMTPKDARQLKRRWLGLRWWQRRIGARRV